MATHAAYWLDLRMMFFGSRKPKNPYASLNRRMWAATFDWLIVLLVAAPVIDIVLTPVFGAPPDSLYFMQALQQHAERNPSAFVGVVIWEAMRDLGMLPRWFADMCLQVLAFFSYSALCWKKWSATPGAMLCRMRVVDAVSEQPLSNQQILFRIAGYVLATFPLLAGFFLQWFTKRRQGWHDLIAHSVVLVQSGKTKSGSAISHP